MRILTNNLKRKGQNTFIKTTILSMVDKLKHNPDLTLALPSAARAMVARTQITPHALIAIECLIHLLIQLNGHSLVADYILRNTSASLSVLCEWGRDGLIATGQTLKMLPKRVVPNGAGVYLLTVDALEGRLESCSQYIGSTCDLPSRYFANQFILSKDEPNTSGVSPEGDWVTKGIIYRSS